jgi:hypothetical protein
MMLGAGDLFAGRGAFLTKAAAVQWAEAQRPAAANGWLEDI